MENRTMLTDLYQLTMLAGYYDNDKGEEESTFDLFIRKLPEDWGYFIANGIEDALDYATSIRFSDDDIDYLREQGIFKEDFLEYLRDFTFTGEISAVPEGTPVTANTPLLRVTAPRSQAQLLETMLLNTINYQTLVASKASRVVNAAGPAGVIDFGLRRAQEGDAAMTGARAAYIAGAIGTSNVAAGKEYGIPIFGTMAHSFVMSFDSELEAFRAYAKTYPENGVLLTDTYDTLQGARNTAIIADELDEVGGFLKGIRLDSGDLLELSKGSRKILDEAGHPEIRISASNDLNEYKIDELRRNDAPIDGYGVGTEMITAKPIAAISGVYKLVEDTAGCKIKLAPEKKTYPGKKQVYRVSSGDEYSHDILAPEGEAVPGKPLLEKKVRGGNRVSPRRSLTETRNYASKEVSMLPASARGVRAAPYRMVPSDGLQHLVDRLTAEHDEIEVAA